MRLRLSLTFACALLIASAMRGAARADAATISSLGYLQRGSSPNCVNSGLYYTGSVTGALSGKIVLCINPQPSGSTVSAFAANFTIANKTRTVNFYCNGIYVGTSPLFLSGTYVLHFSSANANARGVGSFNLGSNVNGTGPQFNMNGSLVNF